MKHRKKEVFIMSKMFKKCFCYTVAFALLASSLTACSTSTDSDSSTQQEASTSTSTEASTTLSAPLVTLDASEGVVAVQFKGETPTGATALFQVSLPEDADYADLDTSKAVLQMTDGDGYYVSEFENPVVNLDPEAWDNGSYLFNFDETAITALFTRAKIRGNESDIYSMGGPDWTAFGGNGNGQYYYNLTLSGLTYQGEPIPDTTFRVCYYAYGRDASDKARITLTDYINVYDYEEAGAQQRTLAEAGQDVVAQDTPVWTWVGEDYEGIPLLCDPEQDDFYITWPEGIDASNLSASDVHVTLYGEYGDVLSLVPDSEYYVYSEAVETQIALPYVHMAFTPVYTRMEISVDVSALSGADKLNFDTLETSYDIASVYTYQVQHGGLNPNGNVLCYQFYGIDEDSLTSWSQLLYGFEYALFTENEDGERLYYSEADGGSYVTDVADATTYDATGPEDLNIHLWNETVVYDTTWRVENEDGTFTYRTEEKTVNGEEVTLNKEVVKGWDGNDLRGVQYSPTEARANGLSPAKGYAFPQTDDFYEKYQEYNFGHDYWVAHSMWPWVEGIEVGWLTSPSDGKASWNGLEKGYNFEYGSDGSYPEWSAPEAQETENWWPWLRSGFPEGMWEAVDAANADTYSK